MSTDKIQFTTSLKHASLIVFIHFLFLFLETTAKPAEALHGILSKHYGNNNKNEVSDSYLKETCVSQECILTASDIIKTMDETVEPCDDFYRFSCGNFLKTESIPEDRVAVNTFSMISDKLQEQLKALITEDRPDTEPKHFILPNKLYRACMNKSMKQWYKLEQAFT